MGHLRQERVGLAGQPAGLGLDRRDGGSQSGGWRRAVGQRVERSAGLIGYRAGEGCRRAELLDTALDRCDHLPDGRGLPPSGPRAVEAPGTALQRVDRGAGGGLGVAEERGESL